MQSVQLRDEPYQAHALIAEYAASLPEGAAGAESTFIGYMRNHREGDNVVAMTLEYYPQMTYAALADVRKEAMDKHALIDALVIHRVGTVTPGMAIVVVAAWSAHRREAFVACREMMEALKSRVPFWKKEILSCGEQRWVDKNTPGY